MTTIDPGVVTLIQSTFLEQISVAFSTTAGYATKLLYLFASLELAALGLVWALQRDANWGKLLFKIIKIGMIFFIIQNYEWLLSTIMHSFAQLAGVVINNSATAQYVFNPAKIWQYGYDVGINLLQIAATTNVLSGLTLIQFSLGTGILLVFGLLGIQMIIQTVSFYLVSFGALILLPFGALASGHKMFDKAVQAVLRAGMRLMVLIIIIGVATVTWDEFQFTNMATGTNFNLNQPLGLFFTALLFLCLTTYLPKVLSEAVGTLSGSMFTDGSPVIITGRESTAAINLISPEGNSNIQAATTLDAGSAIGNSYTHGSGDSGTSAATVIATTASTQLSHDSKAAKESLARASTMPKSISESTVKKIKEAVFQAVQEKTTKN